MATKNSSAKKSSGKKSSAKKSSGKKSSARKSSAKKTSPKKSSTKKSSSKKHARLALTAAAATAAAVAVGVAAKKMAAPCTITTRGDVSRLVLAFVRTFKANAVEASTFPGDINVTPNARRGWVTPISNAVAAKGCNPAGFTPDHCADAGKVGDIVDSLAGVLGV